MGQGARRRIDPDVRMGWLVLFSLLAVCAGPVLAEDDLLDMSLEDLMNVEVTSVSKKAENKQLAAAAITVLTAEDIRRGGFTSVPEALRMVPGVEVARIDASRWAISIRGFRQEFSNKLLVMIDGRSLYTPLFGGVVWAEQNFAMDDIERIEVIRGPGGTIWGANAVNGVINIITKKASDTQGVHGHLFAGTQEAGLGARVGSKIGENTQFRFSGKAEKIQDYDLDKDDNADDEWGQLRLGTRWDSKIADKGNLTVLADYFDLDLEHAIGVRSPPFFNVTSFDPRNSRSRGGDIQAQYAQDLGSAGHVEAKAYYDTVSRRITNEEDSHTLDLAVQHNFDITKDLGMIWGAEYRYWTTHTGDPLGPITYQPNDTEFHLGDAFLQFQLDLLDDHVALIAGTKLGGNNWSGFQYQPSGRIVVKPAEGHTLWAAVSRAVRIPTFTDRDLSGNIGPIGLQGDHDVRSEDLFSAEFGYRFYKLERFTAELSTFYSEYQDILSLTGTFPTYTFDNAIESKLAGGELELSFLPIDRLRITTSYALLVINEDLPNPAIRFPLTTRQNDSDPHHQVTIRSFLKLPGDVEFDSALYWVDGLEGVTPTLRSNNVTQYFRVDLRLAWRPIKGLELSLVGQNLADARHAEFFDIQGNQSSQVPRSGYAMVRFDL